MADALERIQKILPQLTIQEVTDLIADLERERESKVSEARAALLQEVEERAATLGLTAAQLVSGRSAKGAQADGTSQTRGSRDPKGKRKGAEPPPVVFRDPESGGTWAGKGRIPGWLKAAEEQGRNREEFRVGA